VSRVIEVWFYHLQRRRLDAVLPELLQKALDRGWRAAVQAVSEERLDLLDEALWTYSDTSFLAHGRARDGDAELQPIYLSTGIENPNGAAARFFVEGAEIASALVDPATTYRRVINLFDAGSEDEVLRAREQWKNLKNRGYALTYWQQAANGRWEKKA
jgi:DNA polymerase-3 subunit chi